MHLRRLCSWVWPFFIPFLAIIRSPSHELLFNPQSGYQGDIMDEKLVEIREFTGIGYKPIIDFLEWRVAILNYIDEIHPGNIEKMERHNETDEVFVLIKGQGVLFLGDGQGGDVKIQPQVMEPGKIYNVKQTVWHSVVLSRDGSVLIVENRDTGRENTDYYIINPEQRALIIEVARREQSDWR
jgi:hypothetical protein